MATTLICKWNYCKNKNQWTYVYEISTDDKTYLTFDEYSKDMQIAPRNSTISFDGRNRMQAL